VQSPGPVGGGTVLPFPENRAPRLRKVVPGAPCVTKFGQHGKAPRGTCWDESDLPAGVGDAEGTAIVATSAFMIGYYLLSAAGTAVGAYHGWKRDESVGWAIGWALLGGIAPFIVIPVALAQGMGKKKGT
jgi:hypothetical protein